MRLVLEWEPPETRLTPQQWGAITSDERKENWGRTRFMWTRIPVDVVTCIEVKKRRASNGRGGGWGWSEWFV